MAALGFGSETLLLRRTRSVQRLARSFVQTDKHTSGYFIIRIRPNPNMWKSSVMTVPPSLPPYEWMLKTKQLNNVSVSRRVLLSQNLKLEKKFFSAANHVKLYSQGSEHIFYRQIFSRIRVCPSFRPSVTDRSLRYFRHEICPIESNWAWWFLLLLGTIETA